MRTYYRICQATELQCVLQELWLITIISSLVQSEIVFNFYKEIQVLNLQFKEHPNEGQKLSVFLIDLLSKNYKWKMLL